MISRFGCKHGRRRLEFGCPPGIRTPITCSRGRCPAVERGGSNLPLARVARASFDFMGCFRSGQSLACAGRMPPQRDPRLVCASNFRILNVHLKTKPERRIMSSTVTNPTTNKCAHPACSCPVSGGEQYCSTSCAESARQGTTQAQSQQCGCNHDTCALAA